MAAFADEYDGPEFDARMARLRGSPDIVVRAITRDGDLVGSIACFVIDGRTEVAYWIDRSLWGLGIASRALELFVQAIGTRPLYASAASDNLGSLRVLTKAGFVIVGTEVSFANARGADIEETFLRLD
jgi:RimJ/RimL family protein N-acetyltransferase